MFINVHKINIIFFKCIFNVCALIKFKLLKIFLLLLENAHWRALKLSACLDF